MKDKGYRGTKTKTKVIGDERQGGGEGAERRKIGVVRLRL